MMVSRHAARVRGVTFAELLTAMVVVAILAAVAVPMFRNHLLRVQRADAIDALIAVQSGQDHFFGRNARYADGSLLSTPPPAGLGLEARSRRGYYMLELRSGADGLGYIVTAHRAAQYGPSDDSRCVEFSLDQNGRRSALDSTGSDRSADCWH